MRPPIHVRPAEAGDIRAIHAIYTHHVLHGVASFEEVPPDHAELERRRHAMASLGFPYLAATIDGALRGYAYAGPYRTRTAYRFTVEDSVYVAPDALGQGIGQALLRDLVERCTSIGMRQIVAVIGDSGNSASIRLHERLGFQRTGQLSSVGFKFGRWIDSVLMQRALGDGDSTLPPARPPG